MQTLPPTARLIGIGFYIAFCIAAGTIGGGELDKAFDTGKLFTILGLAFGLVLALYGAFRQLMEVLAEINRRRQAQTGEGKRPDLILIDGVALGTRNNSGRTGFDPASDMLVKDAIERTAVRSPRTACAAGTGRS